MELLGAEGSIGGDVDHEPSILERLGWTPWDAVAVGLAVTLIIAFAPPLFFDSWTPRMAIAIAVGPVGLLLVVAQVRSRDVPSTVLVGALVWTVVSGGLGPAPRSALIGFVGRDLSALTMVCAAGFWAVGRMVSSKGRNALADALIWAAAGSAALGVLQVVVGVTDGPLAMLSGRPTGFAANPVYLGAISAAALGAAVARCGDGEGNIRLLPMVAVGVGVTLSGSRIALVAALLGVFVHTAIRRNRSSVVAAVVAVGAMLMGVGIDRVAGAGRNAANRLAEGSGGGRLTVWRYGVDAWIDRPILGHGFGRFRPAVQERFTVDFVRDSARDEVTQAWFDAHNVGIGLLVAVGVVGALLFVVWAVVWGIRIRGPLVWALVPLVLHWMLQPVSLFTLPLAMLLFGAAGVDTGGRSPSMSRIWVSVAAMMGILAGGTLVVADAAFNAAADDVDAERLATISSVFGDDPIMADVVAQAYGAFDGPDERAAALDWRRRAAGTEPDRPYWWSLLAEAQLDAGLIAEAEASIATALDLQPINSRSLRVEALLALRAEDEPRLARALDLLCQLEQSDCALVAADVIVEYRAAESG